MKPRVAAFLAASLALPALAAAGPAPPARIPTLGEAALVSLGALLGLGGVGLLVRRRH